MWCRMKPLFLYLFALNFCSRCTRFGWVFPFPSGDPWPAIPSTYFCNLPLLQKGLPRPRTGAVVHTARLRGVGQFWTASTFSARTSIPVSVNTCPRKLTCLWNKLYFLMCTFRFAALSRVKTLRRRSRWLSKSQLKTIMSSRNTRHVSYVNPQSTKSISRWKTEGAQVNPNSMTLYLKHPHRVMNAVLSLSASRIGMLWYPDRRSNVENQTAPFMEPRQVSICGRG